MATNRIVRIVVGLALIGYGLYSGVVWFYLGALPLITGIINWCPLEMKMGTCDSSTGCCSSNAKDSTESACCLSENATQSESSCCSPKKDATTQVSDVRSFKAVQPSQSGTTLIEILGTGCSKCIALEKVVNEAIKSLDGEYEVKKVSDLEEIMAYKVMSTPGLVINGTVVSTGKVLSIDEVQKIFQ